MKTPFATVVFLLFASCLGVGGGRAEQAPKPGPEVQKLGYYVGSWEGHGETKAGPFGPAGKLSSKMKCEWFAGGFQVLCRGEETGPTGTRQFLNILAYDRKANAYTEYAVSSLGDAEYDSGGSLARNTLTFVVDQKAGGKRAEFHYTEVHVSPVLMTYRAEVSIGGAPLKALAEGKIAKIK